MTRIRFTWMNMPAGSNRWLMYRGKVVLMTLEQTPEGRWYYYGMGQNSLWADKTYDDLDQAKKAVEREAAERISK